MVENIEYQCWISERQKKSYGILEINTLLLFKEETIATATTLQLQSMLDWKINWNIHSSVLQRAVPYLPFSYTVFNLPSIYWPIIFEPPFLCYTSQSTGQLGGPIYEILNLDWIFFLKHLVSLHMTYILFLKIFRHASVCTFTFLTCL